MTGSDFPLIFLSAYKLKCGLDNFVIKFYVTRTRYHRVGHIFITFIYSLSAIRDSRHFQKIFNGFDVFRFE